MDVETTNPIHHLIFGGGIVRGYTVLCVIEIRLCTAHVKMRRAACSSTHVTIFLTDNAHVCWNSSAITKKYKKKQYFSIAHISLTILQMFLVVMMLVNVVQGVC